MRMDEIGALRPDGPLDWMTRGPADFSKVCPFSPEAANEDTLAAELYPDVPRYQTVGRFLSAYVGAAKSGGYRDRGSSGGLVTWTLDALFRAGLIDAAVHVAPVDDPSADPENRFFRYRISRSSEEIRAGAKSRYYPIELSEALREIRSTPGRYAIVGIPCFIKAVHLLRRQDPVMRERIAYTLGLFCGHMKSARFVESFAMQMEVPISEVKAVEFRVKDTSRPASTYTAGLTLYDGSERKRDWWNLVDGDWGSGFFQLNACNFCDDVIAETSDISFGDAWVEPYSSDGRGTNVIVVRRPEVEALIQQALQNDELELSPVDEEFIIQTQAAGFRQRREGLSYRLHWLGSAPIVPKKRVPPAVPDSRRRRLIYRTRVMISRGSHRYFGLARRFSRPGVYTRWGRLAVGFYHGFAYSRGRLGKLFDRLGLK